MNLLIDELKCLNQYFQGLFYIISYLPFPETNKIIEVLIHERLSPKISFHALSEKLYLRICVSRSEFHSLNRIIFIQYLSLYCVDQYEIHRFGKYVILKTSYNTRKNVILFRKCIGKSMQYTWYISHLKVIVQCKIIDICSKVIKRTN